MARVLEKFSIGLASGVVVLSLALAASAQERGSSRGGGLGGLGGGLGGLGDALGSKPIDSVDLMQQIRFKAPNQ